MKSMYVISMEAQSIASMLEDGEFTSELENALVINQNELQEKAVNYGYVIKESENQISLIDAEIKRLQEMKRIQSNKIDKLNETVLNAMNIYGIEKINSPFLNISIRKSESVETSEGLPMEYYSQKTVFTIDKVRIKNAIKAGENIIGATIKENQNLQIK
jgi:hypothetical protein